MNKVISLYRDLTYGMSDISNIYVICRMSDYIIFGILLYMIWKCCFNYRKDYVMTFDRLRETLTGNNGAFSLEYRYNEARGIIEVSLNEWFRTWYEMDGMIGMFGKNKGINHIDYLRNECRYVNELYMLYNSKLYGLSNKDTSIYNNDHDLYKKNLRDYNDTRWLMFISFLVLYVISGFIVFMTK